MNSRRKEYSSILATYLREIGAIPQMSKDEELRVATEAAAGNEVAQQKLVTANLRFVVVVAMQYLRTGMDFIDLIEEGNIGLIKAAKRFDHTRGLKFISYAVWWIRQTILQALYEQSGPVRLPNSRVQAILDVERVAQELTAQLMREPTDQEIATVLEGIAFDDIVEARQLRQDMVTIDNRGQLVLNGTVIELIDQQQRLPDDSAAAVELRQAIEKALDDLPPNQRETMWCRYGFLDGGEMLYEDIGERIGATKGGASWLQIKAIKNLRRRMNRYHLTEFK